MGCTYISYSYFNDTSNYLGYIALNDWCNEVIGKDVEGGGSGIFKDTNPAFIWSG
jgi:hypothetical protein